MFDEQFDLARWANDQMMEADRLENQKLEKALVRYLGYMPSLEEARQHCTRERYTAALDTTFYCWKGESILIVFKKPPAFDTESLTLKGWQYRFEYVGDKDALLEQVMASLDEANPEHQAALADYRKYRSYKEAQ